MPSLLTLFLPLPMALAALLTTVVDARRLAWLGALALGLGVASVRVALRLPLTGSADPLWVAALPPVSLRIDAGLQLLGALLAFASAAWSVMRGGSTRDRLSAALALLAAVGIVATAVPLLRVAGWVPVLGAALALGISGALVGAALSGAAARISALRAPRAAAEPNVGDSRSARWRMLLLLGAIAALVAPHLDFVLGGAALAAIAAHMTVSRTGSARIPIFPAVVLCALGLAGYYLRIIAGPGGGWLASLPEAPLSTAAQALIVPALAAGAAGFFGFWPLGVLTPGPWLAPVGVALLLRIGAASLPIGVDGWRTVMIPIGVVALWGGAFTRRPVLLASAAAWMACFAPAGGGAAGAWCLALVPVMAIVLRPAATTPALRGLTLRAAVTGLIGALGGILALDGLLRAEVVYTALSAAAVAFSAVYISRAPT
jgi:hypothetical protein